MLRTALFFAALAASGHAFANPASVVAGGQDPDHPDAEEAQKSVDIYAEVNYNYELASSTIGRERIGTGADPSGAVPVVRDLAFKSFKHTLTPRLQVGVFRDTFIYAALPIVITQARELSLADGLTRMSSSTVIDGLLSADGFDSRDPGTPTGGTAP